MHICPVCNKEFSSEEAVVKHYLKCWKEHNPYHKSKAAPRSEPITTRIVNAEVANFFSAFQQKG